MLFGEMGQGNQTKQSWSQSNFIYLGLNNSYSKSDLSILQVFIPIPEWTYLFSTLFTSEVTF